METPVTPNAIAAICGGDVVEKPLLQVIGIKPVRLAKDRYIISLSDSAWYQRAVLHAPLNYLVKSGCIKEGSVVQLTDYFCRNGLTQKAFLVLDMKTIIPDHEIMGNPKLYPMQNMQSKLATSTADACHEEDASIPQQQFSFRPMRDIETAENNSITDIIGNQRRILNLKDGSGRTMELTPWGEFCNREGQKLQEMIDSGLFPVLAVKDAILLFPEMSDSVEFTVDFSTSVETIGNLKSRIKRYLESKPKHWRPGHSLVVGEIEDVNKLKLGLYVTHTKNIQNYGDKSSGRSELVFELKKIFEELGIKYHLLPQEVQVSHSALAAPRGRL